MSHAAPQQEVELPSIWTPGRYVLRANLLQIMALPIAIVGLWLPSWWLKIRFATDSAGWFTMGYAYYVQKPALIAQVILLIPFAVRALKTAPPSGGQISTPLLLTADLAFLSTAVLMGDFGDAPDSAAKSWASRALGLPEGVAEVLFWVMAVIWLLALIAAFVMSIVECTPNMLRAKAKGFVPRGQYHLSLARSLVPGKEASRSVAKPAPEHHD